MNPLDTIKRGLVAAVPVCVVVAAVIVVRADAIEAATGAAVSIGGLTVSGWIGSWTIITLAFGVAATGVHDYLRRAWGWSGTEYLVFAMSLAAALSALAFLRIYNGEVHPFRIEYGVFNFAYAIGFGYAIPVLTASETAGTEAKSDLATQ